MKSYSPLLLIIVAIGIFFFYIDPQYKELKELRQVQIDNEELLTKAAQLRAGRESLNTRYKAISPAEKEQLEKVLPETVDNVRLILAIDTIAQNYGIVLRGITITGGTESADTKSKQIVDKTSNKNGVITLGFSFTASYDTFKKFLIDLEDSLRIVDVTDFTVTANEQSNVYDYSLKLNTYWLR
jgi:Tfp pilus assembly protein PilO